MSEQSKQEQILKTISQALSAHHIADAAFAKEVEQARVQRQKTILKHDQNLESLLNIYKDAALKLAVTNKRYLDDDVGLPRTPDRMSINADGIRLEWDYEYRGDTEQLIYIAQWSNILDLQPSE